MTPAQAAERIKHRAFELGFHAIGITDLGATAHADALKDWLAAGMAGDMRYMHRQASKRARPAEILPGAIRAVVVLRYYASAEAESPSAAPAGKVARYARGRDYHDVLAPDLKALAEYIRSLGPAGTVARAFVDAGPVPERELAQRSGLGWIGKNTMLIQPRHGSFSFIGTILASLDIAVDEPFEPDRCGSCRRCLDACPTQAFTDARHLDARRCIAYLTIEYKGDPNPALAPLMGDWVFGCDVCQEVCPWNVRFADTIAGSLPGDPSLARLDLEALSTITDEQFSARFATTPLTRAGAEGMRRNAKVALANLEGRAGT